MIKGQPKVLLFFMSLLAIAAAACGGDSGQDNSTAPSPASTPDPVLSDPSRALVTSGERLTRDVQSGRSEFNWEIEREGFHLQGNGKYSVQSTGNLHLEAHYQGQGDTPQQFREANDSELLALDQAIYLKTPVLGDDWVLFTSEEFGVDWDVTQRLVLNRSPLNYQTVTSNAVGEIASLGAESIDGREYAHYRTTVDAGTLMNALADAYGSQGQVFLANRFSGPIPTDIWVDPVTLLPRRLRAGGDFTFMDASTRLGLTVDFLDLNSLDEFPKAPEDATPFQELVG